jgi:hypothetical protein
MMLELFCPDIRGDCPAAESSQILTNADNCSCFAGARKSISEYDDICGFGFDAGQ